MKILHLITGLKVGGAESALYNLLHQLKYEPNHEHYVAYFYPGPNVARIESLGIPTFQIKGLVHKYDPIAYWRLKQLIKQINPDIIHSALWSANIIGRLIAHRLKIPIICDLHSNMEHDGTLRFFLERFFLDKAQQYIAVSKTAHSGFMKAASHIITDKQSSVHNKIQIIQNGINFEQTRDRAFSNPKQKVDLGFAKTDFVVGAVGRLEPIKSYDLLIKAFALIQKEKKHLKLCIIGDGSEKEKLKILCDTLGITEHVHFAGQRTDALSFYPLFDCFALSSVSEGLSIALLEAMSCELPVITTHRFATHEVIDHDKNGLLVPVNNPKKLACAILKLYQNPDLRKQMGAHNTHLARTTLNITQTGGAYKKIYKQFAR